MTTGKTIVLMIWIFVGKVMCLLLNTLSRFLITFLPRCKCLLISWLSQSLSAVILEPKKIKSVTASIFFHSICHEMMGPDAMILFSLMLSFMPTFSVSSFILIKRFFSSSSLVPLEWYYLRIWGCWYFSQLSWLQLVIHAALHFTWCTLHRS